MITVKYLYQWILIIVFLALAGCSGYENNTPTAEIASFSPFKVALLLPRAIDADSWTRSGYDGLLLIEKELGAEIAYTENIPEAGFEKIFRQYATDGFDFIIGHGGQFIPAAEVVAEEFPRTKFAVVGKYGGNNKNLGALSMRADEVSYLVGVVAALKTKTNRVGYLGGQLNEAGQESATLFERGVKDTNPVVEVSIDWVGSWSDEDKAKQMARTQINDGVDVMVVTSNAVVHTVAAKAGIYTIGWIEDLHQLAPNTVLTSNVQSIPILLLKGATLARKGRWEGRQYKFGLLEGVQQLAPFYGLLTPEEEAHIGTVKEDIVNGKIDTTP